MQESIAGIRVVKAFAQEEEDFKQFEKACENSREKNLAVVKLRAVFGPALDAVIGISVIVTLLEGSHGWMRRCPVPWRNSENSLHHKREQLLFFCL